MNYPLSSTSYHQDHCSNTSPITTAILISPHELNSRITTIIQQIITPKIHATMGTAFQHLNEHSKQPVLSKQMLVFINHCATIIQSHFRGYREHKYYRLFKPLLHRFKELLSALVQGWKIRKIMRMSYIVKKYQKIKQHERKGQLREARIGKREIIEDIQLMQYRGNWIVYHQNDMKKDKSKTTNIKLVLGSKTTSSITPNTQKPNNNQSASKQQQLTLSPIKKKIQQQQIIPLKQQQKLFTSSPQQQIPIKASGFYLMPDAPFQHQPKTKQVSQAKNNKVAKQLTKKQTKPKCLPIDQTSRIKTKTSINESNKKCYIPNKKKEQPSILSLTMDMPMQHPSIQQQISIPNKTIKMQWIKQHLNTFETNVPILPLDPKQQTQKLKKNQKGIKVTLSTTSLKDHGNGEKREKGMANDIIREKDQLSEIMEVYNNTYTNKNIQITNRLNQLKTKRKFVQ